MKTSIYKTLLAIGAAVVMMIGVSTGALAANKKPNILVIWVTTLVTTMSAPIIGA